MKNKNQLGFTLLEVLLVVVIIAILAGVVYFVLHIAQRNNRDAQRVADGNLMSKALSSYYNEFGAYPVADSPTVADIALQKPLVPRFTDVVPAAPTPPEGHCTSDQNKYIYHSDGSTYSLQFCIGSTVGDYQAGPYQITPTGFFAKSGK